VTETATANPGLLADQVSSQASHRCSTTCSTTRRGREYLFSFAQTGLYPLLMLGELVQTTAGKWIIRPLDA
jgi:hypothetical protein